MQAGWSCWSSSIRFGTIGDVELRAEFQSNRHCEAGQNEVIRLYIPR
jgi:hypothetical protein